MKYVKVLIISLIIIIIFLVGILLYLNVSQKNNESENTENAVSENIILNEELEDNNEDNNNVSTEVNTVSEENIEPEIDTSIKAVTDRKAFYTVEDCIKKFINYGVDQEYYAVYALLDQEFIDANQVTEENVAEKVEMFETSQMITIKEMYSQNIEKNGFTKYYTYAKVRNINVADGEEVVENDYYITVILNDNKMYYTINPSVQDYQKNMGNYEGK